MYDHSTCVTLAVPFAIGMIVHVTEGVPWRIRARILQNCILTNRAITGPVASKSTVTVRTGNHYRSKVVQYASLRIFYSARKSMPWI